MTKQVKLPLEEVARWCQCPGSIVLGEIVGREVDSEMSQRKAYTHALAEWMLRHSFGEVSKENYPIALKQLSLHYGGMDLEQEMGFFVETVKSYYDEERCKKGNHFITLGKTLELNKWIPNHTLVCDVIIGAANTLHIICLVDEPGELLLPEENKLMWLYGLGALASYDLVFDVQKMILTTISIDSKKQLTYETTPSDLLKWGESVLKPKALMALQGEESLQVGAYCKGCPAEVRCREKGSKSLELAGYSQKPLSLYSEEELGSILTEAGQVVYWIEALTDYMYTQALEGAVYPGWKLVEGRSSRRYSAIEDVLEILLKAGYQEEQLYERKFLTLSALEKWLGKKNVKALIGELIEEVPGKPVLVPEQDRRLPISQLQRARQ